MASCTESLLEFLRALRDCHARQDSAARKGALPDFQHSLRNRHLSPGSVIRCQPPIVLDYEIPLYCQFVLLLAFTASGWRRDAERHPLHCVL